MDCYLALDQAMKTTGWAIFTEEGELYDCGTFTIPADEEIGKRLTSFYAELERIGNDNPITITDIFFEDIQLQMGNVKTYQRLAMIQAMIYCYCNLHGKNYKVLAPSHWRKILGGSWGRKREEQKQHAISFVKEKYGKDVSSDIADAICLGVAAIQEKSENLFGEVE